MSAEIHLLSSSLFWLWGKLYSPSVHKEIEVAQLHGMDFR